MTIPKVPTRQITHFVADEFKAFADDTSAVEELYDYSVIGNNKNKGGLDVFGVAAGRPLIKPYIDTFGASGFKVRKIDVGVNALIKTVRSYAPQLASGTNLFMFIDAKTLFITLFEDGDFRIIKKYRLLSEEGTAEHYQEVGNHLSAMVQFQMGQHHGAGIRNIFIAGMTSEQLAIFAETVRYFNIPVEGLQLDQYIDLVGKAGFDRTEFKLSKYLLNVGGLRGK
jgi:Tfp pilus assembly PilM family ATPase